MVEGSATVFGDNMLSKVLGLTYQARHWRTRIARSDYKSTWNRLAYFEHDAKIGVAGVVDETIITASTAFTIQMLDATIGIRPEDVVLEIGAGIGRVGAVLAPRCRKWIGTDVSRHMVAHMRRRLAGISNVDVVEISGYDLTPIPSESASRRLS